METCGGISKYGVAARRGYTYDYHNQVCSKRTCQIGDYYYSDGLCDNINYGSYNIETGVVLVGVVAGPNLVVAKDDYSYSTTYIYTHSDAIKKCSNVRTGGKAPRLPKDDDWRNILQNLSTIETSLAQVGSKFNRNKSGIKGQYWSYDDYACTASTCEGKYAHYMGFYYQPPELVDDNGFLKTEKLRVRCVYTLPTE